MSARPHVGPGFAHDDTLNAPVRRRERAGRVGYAPGVFDLFHIGHLNILRQAKARCDYLIAGVVSDDNTERAKGRRPVVPFRERLEIVSHIDLVDEVHPEVLPDKLDTWRDVGFDVYFKGDDWRGTPAGIDLEHRFAEVGVVIEYFPYTLSTSSTLLTRAITSLAERGAAT